MSQVDNHDRCMQCDDSSGRVRVCATRNARYHHNACVTYKRKTSAKTSADIVWRVLALSIRENALKLF
jgi:hypothetical protein